MRISDWSSDVCSSDLGNLPWRRQCCHCQTGRGTRRPPNCVVTVGGIAPQDVRPAVAIEIAGASYRPHRTIQSRNRLRRAGAGGPPDHIGATAEAPPRSEEHTSELQSLMRISYAVSCLTKKK